MTCHNPFFCSYKKWVTDFFNRQKLFQKAKSRYCNGGGKEKTAKYYIENKEDLKENWKKWV